MDQVSQDGFPPDGVDLDRPSIARIYDYMLGGTANWAIDRELGDKALETFPLMRPAAQANRQFLFRVVRHLMRLGIRQFVDVGAGIPTMDHTHSVADAYEHGTARVVYVDNEPVAVAHAQILLEQQGDRQRHTAINGDLRAPARLWEQIAATGLIDTTQPVALLMIAVLHLQQLDQDGADITTDIVARYRDLLPPGSYLAISHLSDDGVTPEVATKVAEVTKLFDRSTNPVILRSHQQITALFGDFELIEPGVTWTLSWHPEEAQHHPDDPTFDHPSESVIYGAVGRKPH
jgi:hypothetical protein